MEMPPQIYLPDVIDIEVTGKCEYNCPGCWGSKPQDYERELSTKQWLRLFDRLDSVGIDNPFRVVITGGEPLLRKDIGQLVSGLCDSDRGVSLSTTGLDHQNVLKSLLQKLSSIGIPIDGSTPEKNSSWRKHEYFTDGGLNIALNALKLIQKVNPELQTSVRTLLHRENIDTVTEIPAYLEKSGIDISKLRWILYELNNRKTIKDNYNQRLVSTGVIAASKFGSEHFNKEIMTTGSNFKEVVIRTIGNIAYRNFIINPSGECRAVIASDMPGELIERQYGNIYSNFKDTINFLNQDIETIGAFSQSATLTPEYFYKMQEKGIDI